MFVTKTLSPFVTFDAPDDGGSAEPAGSGDYIRDTLDAAGAPAEPVVDATEPAAEPAAPVDPFEEFGGRQSIEDAVAISRALGTETGVRQMAAETLKALGLAPQQIEAVLSGQAFVSQTPEGGAEAGPDPVFGDLTDDDVVTVADMKRLLGELQQEIRQPWEQAQTQQRVDRAAATVDTTLASLGVEDPNLSQLVLLEASKILPQNEWDPAKIEQAIRTGHANVTALMEQARQEYLGKKIEQADSLPTHIGDVSGSAGGSDAPEPASLDEAIKRVRESLRRG